MQLVSVKLKARLIISQYFLLQTLVKEIAPLITKQTTMMRKPIDPEIKLAITLRFLATGESYESFMYQFRVHSCTIAKFIPVVCSKIYETFKGQFL